MLCVGCKVCYHRMHEKASAISDFLCIIANGAGSKKDQEFDPLQPCRETPKSEMIREFSICGFVQYIVCEMQEIVLH